VARFSSGGVAICFICTSGFVDDVIFSHNDPLARRLYSWVAMDRKSLAVEIPTKFCSTWKPTLWVAHREKSSINDCLVLSWRSLKNLFAVRAGCSCCCSWTVYRQRLCSLVRFVLFCRHRVRQKDFFFWVFSAMAISLKITSCILQIYYWIVDVCIVTLFYTELTRSKLIYFWNAKKIVI